jgi:hypothetical protein
VNSSFLYQIPNTLIILVLFILIILAQWIGFRVKQTVLERSGDVKDAFGSVEGSLLGLLALLLSFTFSLSASKNESRRQVIIEEANDLGTVILRCDLYQDKERQILRAGLQQYLEARIAYYQAGTDQLKINQALVKSDQDSRKLWSKVTQLARDKENIVATQQMVPALNNMIDIVTTRDAGNNAHIPDSILWLLFMLTVVGGFLIGYSSKGDGINWIVVCGFALVMVMTIYLIIDLDRPRQGIINMDLTQRKMIELRAFFK